MAALTRELEKLIVSKKLAHGGNPVTRCMPANVAVAQDPAGTCFGRRVWSKASRGAMVGIMIEEDDCHKPDVVLVSGSSWATSGADRSSASALNAFRIWRGKAMATAASERSGGRPSR